MHESLGQYPSDFLKVAYQEAFLIHIVAIPRLYAVLVYLLS